MSEDEHPPPSETGSPEPGFGGASSGRFAPAEPWADSDVPSAASQELSAFVQRMKARTPYATVGLAIAVAIVFAMQIVVGFDPPALLRMGALRPVDVMAGEVWRLASCTLLHGGYMHVAFNVYVLIILGVFLERVIGTGRFLLLYSLSALAGSLGSVMLLGDGFSVGASGAVWGLLGAHAVLAFAGGDHLPQALVPGARKAAAINLGLNILNSFRPNVDLWAHFAGGMMGALVLFAMRSSLPTVSAPTEPIAPAGVRIGASFGAMLLGASIVLAVASQDPFALDQPPVLVDTAVPERGVSLQMPAGLPVQRLQEETAFGDVYADPAVVSVVTFVTGPIPADQLETELLALEQSIELVPGTHRTQEAQRFTGGDVGLTVRSAFESGLLYDQSFLFLPDRVLRIDVVRWPDYAAAPADLAERIARSARLL